MEASTGRFAAAEGTLRICVTSATAQGDANFAALCRINLRFVRQIQGKSPGPESRYREDLKALERSGQAVLVGTALAKSAELQEKAGDHAGALNTLLAAQKRFAESGSVPAQTRHRLRLVQAYQNLERWGDAERELDGLVIAFANMSNRPALVTAHALRGKQHAHAGKGGDAVADFEKSLQLAKRLGSPQLVANSRLAVCEYYALSNAMDAALKHCDQAASGFRKIGALTLASRAEVFAARVAQAQQNWLEARKRYLRAIETLEKDVAPAARDARNVAVQRANLCQVELQLESNGAHSRCLQARKALAGVKANDASYRGMIAATEYAVGVLSPADRADDAMKSLERAADVWGQLDNPLQAADALLRLGKLQDEDEAAGKRKRATGTFQRALALAGAPTSATTPLLIQIRIQLAQRQIAEAAWTDAIANLGALIEAARAANDASSGAWAHNSLASARLKTGDRAGAIDALTKALPLAKQADDEELAAMIERNLAKLKGKP